MPESKRIGQYEILDLLGRGAMGEVYKAVDSKMFGRAVAIKVLSDRLSRNEQALTRFKREVEVAARLEHPNIVTIHDRGQHEDRHYFVMEYIDGTDLTSLISDRKAQKLEDLLTLAGQFCEAIEFAHTEGVIHRDIKPSNIMITHRGGQGLAKLVDFGIVHIERSDLTRSQTQPGTFSYMSPEQLRNDEVDHRSDLFSLGIVLYEMFTGIHPFDSASEALTTQRILADEPEPPKQVESTIPTSLESLILKLLDKDPRQRPQTTAEVTGALRETRRRYMSRGVSDAGDYSNVEEMTRPMVENLVTFGRKKEAEGDLPAAVQAYEKASNLAPDMDRLERKIHKLKHRIESEKKLDEHFEAARAAISAGDFDAADQCRKDAWILSPESERVAELEREIREGRENGAPTSGPSGPAAGAGAAAVVEGAQAAMDQGDFDAARHRLVDAIRKYPDDVQARFLLDRVMQVFSWGGDYIAYRKRLGEAQAALARDDFGAARSAWSEAKGLWPEDDEWKPLEREIRTRESSRIDEKMTRAEKFLEQAADAGDDEASGVTAAGRAIETLEQARDLGCEEGRWSAPLEEARRLQADLKRRVERREAEAEAGRQQISRELAAAEESLRESERQLESARGILEEARAAGEGSAAAVERGLSRLAEGKLLVERSLQLDPQGSAAQALLEDIEAAESTLKRQRRLLVTKERGLEEGRAAMIRAREMVVEESLDELRRGETLCRDAEQAFRAVVTVDDHHEEAQDALKSLVVLAEHFQFEIQRREADQRKAEESRLQLRNGLLEAAALMDRAEAQAAEGDSGLEGALTSCASIAEMLGRVAAIDPDHDELRGLRKRRERLQRELESRKQAIETAAAAPPKEEVKPEPKAEPRAETGKQKSRSKRKKDLDKANKHLAEARDLLENGKHDPAAQILEELESACREREWLSGLLPEIEKLFQKIEKVEPAPPRRNVPLIAAAVVVPLVLLVGGWLLMRGGGEDTPQTTQAAQIDDAGGVAVPEPQGPVAIDETPAVTPPEVEATDGGTTAETANEVAVGDSKETTDLPPAPPVQPPVEPRTEPVEIETVNVGDPDAGMMEAGELTAAIRGCEQALSQADAGNANQDVIIGDLRSALDVGKRLLSNRSGKENQNLPELLRGAQERLDVHLARKERTDIENALREANQVAYRRDPPVSEGELARIKSTLAQAEQYVSTHPGENLGGIVGIAQGILAKIPEIDPQWYGIRGTACVPGTSDFAEGVRVAAVNYRDESDEWGSTTTNAQGQFSIPLQLKQKMFLVVSGAQGRSTVFNNGGLGYQVFNTRDRTWRPVETEALCGPGN